jgi:hypothetical protein
MVCGPGTKGPKLKIDQQIGHLEKRSSNGWRKRQVTLVVLHKAVLDVLTNPRKSHGHGTWCRGARPVPPWACVPGRRLGPLP